MAQLFINWVDVGIAFLLLNGVLMGVYHGLIRQAILLASVYISTVLAAQYYGVTADILRRFAQDSDPVARSFAAFALVFFVALVVLNWLGFAVYGNTRLPFLAAADAVGGALLGLVSSWALTCVALIIVNYGLKGTWIGVEPTISFVREQMVQSFLSPVVSSYLPTLTSTLLPWLPGGLPAFFAL